MKKLKQDLGKQSPAALPSENRIEPLFVTALLYLFIPSTIVLLYFGRWPIVTLAAVGAAIFWLVKPSPKTAEPPSRSSPSDFWLTFRQTLRNTWPYMALALGAVWLSG